jgi:hypothetical protein
MTVITIAMTDITEPYWGVKKRFGYPFRDKTPGRARKNFNE